MISIIIPSRNEQFLSNTIVELFKKAKGDIEIIAVLDGYWPSPPLDLHPNLILLHKGQSEGMREGINSGVAVASGEYIMKIDAHCMVDEGFDVKLQQDMEDNWVVIPRRKRLDAENWCIQDVGKPDIDAMFVCYPDDPNDFGGKGLNGKLWTRRTLDRADKLIDEDLSFQGSCWFMKKDYFYELDLMDTKGYGIFWNEAQEIGLKCWLSGGKVIRNKKTWYAHLHKGKKYGRGYFLNRNTAKHGAVYTMKWFYGTMDWPKQKYPLSWLIERFMPVPTWDENKILELKNNGN